MSFFSAPKNHSKPRLNFLIRLPIRNKKEPSFRMTLLFLAEQEGFEPSVPFWGTHDFQSCPL